MNYAKAFRVVRAAYGLRQSELAEQLSIGASQLSLIEAGKRQPSLRVVDELARALQMPKALVVLLASEPAELTQQNEENVSDLSRALLRLLVATSKESRLSTLPFTGPKT